MIEILRGAVVIRPPVGRNRSLGDGDLWHAKIFAAGLSERPDSRQIFRSLMLALIATICIFTGCPASKLMEPVKQGGYKTWSETPFPLYSTSWGIVAQTLGATLAGSSTATVPDVLIVVAQKGPAWRKPARIIRPCCFPGTQLPDNGVVPARA